MTAKAPLVRNIADTARWVAWFRMKETERPDALFRDPYAARLAGERGRAMGESMHAHHWAFVMRTWIFDQLLERCVADGADGVVNLAAGMCARPYRMKLPASLRWFEVDVPEILDEKEALLAAETPNCRLERVRLDLADVERRRALFARIARETTNVVVLTEGLLIYLRPEEVAALARDLAAAPSFRRWIVDLCSPGLLRMMQKEVASRLGTPDTQFHFGPAEGPHFFEPHGWRPLDVPPSLIKLAAKHKRAPFPLNLIALLPESRGRQGGRPWGGAALLERFVA
jgi:methyltransferase (TIGR00027 family)